MQPAAPAGEGQPAPLAADPEIQRAFDAYRNAPDDVTAYAHLVQVVQERATKAAADHIFSALNQRAQQHQTRVGVARAKQGVATAVNSTLSQHFPDVNLKIFWQVAAPQAQAETPSNLSTFESRIQWQTERAVQIAREIQNSFAGPAEQATHETQATRLGAAAVMPGGGSQPPAAGATPAPKPKTFIEQMREQREKVGAA